MSNSGSDSPEVVIEVWYGLQSSESLNEAREYISKKAVGWRPQILTM